MTKASVDSGVEVSTLGWRHHEPTVQEFWHVEVAVDPAVGELHFEGSALWIEATEALRGLIDAIVLIPDQGALRIELKGNLAAMLSAATNAKRSPETGDLSLQVQMVAGACSHRYLRMWNGAA